MKTITLKCRMDPEESLEVQKLAHNIMFTTVAGDGTVISIMINDEDAEKVCRFLQPAETKRPHQNEA